MYKINMLFILRLNSLKDQHEICQKFNQYEKVHFISSVICCIQHIFAN